MKGVEVHLHVVVVRERIAGKHVRPDQLRIGVAANKRDEQVLVGIAEIGSGGLGRSLAVIGIALHEIGDAQHLLSRAGWCELEEVLEHGRRIEAGDLDVGWG